MVFCEVCGYTNFIFCDSFERLYALVNSIGDVKDLVRYLAFMKCFLLYIIQGWGVKEWLPFLKNLIMLSFDHLKTQDCGSSITC